MKPEAPASVEPALEALLSECRAGALRERPEPVVLLVDDAAANIEVLAGVLEGYDLLFAKSGAEALALADVENPDLILLDVMLPDWDGFEVCRRLKANPRWRKIPVIFVTALNKTPDEARGLEAGAIDYITKPISPPIVRARVRNHLELKLARDLLEHRALVDGLTGVANRRRFDEFLEQEWRRAVRSGLPLSIIMLDLDFFKFYNDAYGHPAGDACLRQIAGVLRTALQRPADLAARYGGEEFACVLPETDATGAGWVAQRIQTGLAARALPHPQSPLGTWVTVSQGVFTGWPARGGVAADWVKAADRLLYAAKTGGRNRIMGQAVELTSSTEGTRLPTARLRGDNARI